MNLHYLSAMALCAAVLGSLVSFGSGLIVPHASTEPRNGRSLISMGVSLKGDSDVKKYLCSAIALSFFLDGQQDWGLRVYHDEPKKSDQALLLNVLERGSGQTELSYVPSSDRDFQGCTHYSYYFQGCTHYPDTGRQASLWRFRALGDPTVRRVAIIDADDAGDIEPGRFHGIHSILDFFKTMAESPMLRSGSDRKPWALTCNNGFGPRAIDASLILMENYGLPMRTLEETFCMIERTSNWTSHNYRERNPVISKPCEDEATDYGRDELFLQMMVRPILEDASRAGQLHYMETFVKDRKYCAPRSDNTTDEWPEGADVLKWSPYPFEKTKKRMTDISKWIEAVAPDSAPAFQRWCSA